jgi:hypothetical protein
MDDRRSLSHATDELAPRLAQALARICEAEGVVPTQVQSIEIDDDEISVRIERRGGGSRIVTYPVTVVLPGAAKSGRSSAPHQ